MKISTISAIAAAVLFSVLAGTTQAEVISSVEGTIRLGESPVDTAVTADGRSTYVLTDKGNVLIYDREGKMKESIAIGRNFDSMNVSPDGETLILSSTKDRIVQTVSLDFVKEIDTADAPFKGVKDAPVVIAVFSDFQ